MDFSMAFFFKKSTFFVYYSGSLPYIKTSESFILKKHIPMLLSKSCNYGIRATIYLAIHHDRKFIPIKEVANAQNISFHFLTKILQMLTKSGYINSIKGPHGGVSLKGDPDKLTVYDIILAIDGTKIFDECVLGLPGCSDKNPCPLHRIWRVVKEELRSELKSESISDLARQIKEGTIRL
jgi:Rrf2 family iron-sulfur cluster assembly transcriptional regulator